MQLAWFVALLLLQPTKDEKGMAVIPRIDSNGPITGMSNLLKGRILACCIRKGTPYEQVMRTLIPPPNSIWDVGGGSVLPYRFYGLTVSFDSNDKVTFVTVVPFPR